MNNKFCLSVTYDDRKGYERCFNGLSEVPPFIKENYLKYGIACIVFADDMSEVESTDFEALFKNILEENDPETMALYGEHIEVWENLDATYESIEKVVEVFNERYSKELNRKPKLKFYNKESYND